MTKERSSADSMPDTPEEHSEEKILKTRGEPTLASQLLLKPRILLGTLLMYAGVGIYFFVRSDIPFSLLLERYGTAALALTVGGAGFYLFFSEFSKMRPRREPRFVDVDERIRTPSLSLETDQIIARLRQELHAKIEPVKPNKPTSQDAEISSSATPNFVLYFDSLRRLLEQKASIADEKASILLDKGTAYSRFGITFFILCIIAWQMLSYWTGFQHQYIYGIVSTSLLFIFIEFLSAWFLKQYRQFIDTSTYLIKVKSIFDRYMLVYLASKESIDNGHDSKKSTHLLLDLLRSDISWPDTYLTKSPDINFAKEALETMTLLVKSMKSEAKESIKKESLPTTTQK